MAEYMSTTEERRMSRLGDTIMHESHDTVLDGGNGPAVCIDCSCCECHRPEIAAAPCAGRCTCPSGDGSLRWPCRVHPPVDVEIERQDHA